MKKKIFSYLLTLVLCIIGSSACIVNATEPDPDDFLRNTGMPQSVIDCLTENRKQLIVESLDLNSSFCSYEEKNFLLNDNNSGIQAVSTISDSDLTLSIVAYSCKLSGIGDAYVFFPSFIWNKDVKIKNDSFAFALYPNWEVLATEDYNLEVWIKNIYGDKVQSSSVAATHLTSNGQSYTISDIGFMQGLYEGNAIFYAKKTDSNATHSIILEYIHDNSTSRDISYSVAIQAASISVSISSDKLDIKTDYFTFN